MNTYTLRFIRHFVVWVGLWLASSSALAQPKVQYFPAVYDTVHVTIMTKPPTFELVHHPAILDTQFISVTLREASRIKVEVWEEYMQLIRRADANEIAGRWAGVRREDCDPTVVGDCYYEIWIPESPQYEVKRYKNYRGAYWSDDQIPALTIRVPRIVLVQDAWIERIEHPATYQVIERYELRRRARRVIYDDATEKG